jgi:hypothetical protein
MASIQMRIVVSGVSYAWPRTEFTSGVRDADAEQESIIGLLIELRACSGDRHRSRE